MEESVTKNKIKEETCHKSNFQLI